MGFTFCCRHSLHALFDAGRSPSLILLGRIIGASRTAVEAGDGSIPPPAEARLRASVGECWADWIALPPPHSIDGNALLQRPVHAMMMTSAMGR